MKRIDLIIFDLDGTLVDSSQDLIEAVNYTRTTFGLSPLSPSTVISYVGDGTDKLVERFLGVEHRDLFAEAMEVFLEYYNRHLLDNSVLYPGVRVVLDYFRDKKKVIVTNKRYHLTRKLTDALGITGYFKEIIGLGVNPFRKPDPKVLLPLLHGYAVDPAATVIIGDGINDIKLALNTGIKSCAALYGFTPKEVLISLNPDFICENIREMMELFC